MEQGGFGFTFELEVAGTYTVVANIENMGIPEFEKLVAEITSHDSPGRYAEYISTGKRKLNEFTLGLIWDPSSATHAALIAAFDSDDASNMRITDAESLETIAFAGIVTKIGRVAEQEEGYKADVTIQPTGQPTIT